MWGTSDRKLALESTLAVATVGGSVDRPTPQRSKRLTVCVSAWFLALKQREIEVKNRETRHFVLLVTKLQLGNANRESFRLPIIEKQELSVQSLLHARLEVADLVFFQVQQSAIASRSNSDSPK